MLVVRWTRAASCDIHTDIIRCSDLRDYLSEICELLSLGFTMPENFVAHRWLSAYDVALCTLRLWDAYVILYSAFLTTAERATSVVEVLRRRGVGLQARGRISEPYQGG